MLYLGVEIGGTKLQIVAGDERAQIKARRRFTVDVARGGAGIREQIRQGVCEVLQSSPKPEAVGIGFGGPVDWQKGEVCCSHHIEGWSGFPLAKWLSDLTQAPVVMDNDANTAALGEAMHGAGAGKCPVFYITLGSGVGGGLVRNGEIFHGAKPGEAEIGHVRIDRTGAILESRCSGWAVDAKIRAAIAENPLSLLAKFSQGMTSGQAKALKPALDAGDELAQRILEETAADLAFGLSHVTHLFHPEIIVMGGGLSMVGEPLRQATEIALRSWTMAAFAPGPEIVSSKFGEDSVPVGALTLARLSACKS